MYSWIIIGEWWTLLTACETLQTAATGNSSNVNTYQENSYRLLLKEKSLINLKLLRNCANSYFCGFGLQNFRLVVLTLFKIGKQALLHMHQEV